MRQQPTIREHFTRGNARPASNVINIMDALRKSVADELESRKAG